MLISFTQSVNLWMARNERLTRDMIFWSNARTCICFGKWTKNSQHVAVHIVSEMAKEEQENLNYNR